MEPRRIVESPAGHRFASGHTDGDHSSLHVPRSSQLRAGGSGGLDRLSAFRATATPVDSVEAAGNNSGRHVREFGDGPRGGHSDLLDEIASQLGAGPRLRSSSSVGSQEEDLSLLRQQLSAVQRIRAEHERKDALIASLRLQVAEERAAGERAQLLADEKAALARRNAGLQQQVLMAQSTQQDLTAKHGRREEEWRGALAEWQAKLEQARGDLAQERAKCESLSSRGLGVERELAKTKAQLDALRTDKEAEAELHASEEARSRAATDRLHSDLVKGRAEVKRLQDQLASRDASVARAQEDTRDAQEQARRLSEERDLAERRLEQCRERAEAVEVELARLALYRPMVEQQHLLEHENGALRDGVRALESERSVEVLAVRSLEAQLTEAKATVTRMEPQLAELQEASRRNAAVQGELEAVQGELEATKCRLADAEGREALLQGQATGLSAALDALTDVLCEAAVVGASRAQLPFLRTSHESAARDMRALPDLLSRVGELESQLPSAPSRLQTPQGGPLEGAHRALRAAARELRGALKSWGDARAEAVAAANKVAEQAVALRSADERIQALEDSKDGVNEALGVTERTLTTLRADLEDAQEGLQLERGRARALQEEVRGASKRLQATLDALAVHGGAGRAAAAPPPGSPSASSSDEGLPPTPTAAGSKGCTRLASAVLRDVRALLQTAARDRGAVAELETRATTAEGHLGSVRRWTEERNDRQRREKAQLVEDYQRQLTTEYQRRHELELTAAAASEELTTAVAARSCLELQLSRLQHEVDSQRNDLQAAQQRGECAEAALGLLGQVAVPLVQRCQQLIDLKQLATRLLWGAGGSHASFVRELAGLLEDLCAEGVIPADGINTPQPSPFPRLRGAALAVLATVKLRRMVGGSGQPRRPEHHVQLIGGLNVRPLSAEGLSLEGALQWVQDTWLPQSQGAPVQPPLGAGRGGGVCEALLQHLTGHAGLPFPNISRRPRFAGASRNGGSWSTQPGRGSAPAAETPLVQVARGLRAAVGALRCRLEDCREHHRRDREQHDILTSSASKTLADAEAELNQRKLLETLLEERVATLEQVLANSAPQEQMHQAMQQKVQAEEEAKTLRTALDECREAYQELKSQRDRDTARARSRAGLAEEQEEMRACLKEEIFRLRAHVQRSESVVQELQEEAQRQAVERQIGRRLHNRGLPETQARRRDALSP